METSRDLPSKATVRRRRRIAIVGIVMLSIAIAGIGVLEARWEPDRAYENAVRKDAPNGWWRFDELGGVVAQDSASGKNALYGGGVILGVEGALTNRIDTAANFTGATSVPLGDRFDFPGRAPFTVEAWVKPRSPQPARFSRIVSKERFGSGGQRDGWALYLDESLGRIGFERLSGRRRPEAAVAEADLFDDRYHHLVGTFDGSTLRLYLDGENAGVTRLAKPGALADTDAPLTIGRLWRPATAFYAGHIDEVAVYDRALHPGAVEDHWDAAR